MPQAHILTLTFSPEQQAPYRRCKFGTWRVRTCLPCFMPLAAPFVVGGEMFIMSARPIRRGALINPAKTAIEYLRSTHG